jgi:hypothetical protein
MQLKKSKKLVPSIIQRSDSQNTITNKSNAIMPILRIMKTSKKRLKLMDVHSNQHFVLNNQKRQNIVLMIVSYNL